MKVFKADLFAEYRLLKTLFHQPSFLLEVTEDIFSTVSNKNIYRSLVNLNKANIPFTKESVQQEFSNIDVDGDSRLLETILSSDPDSTSTVEDMVLQLQNAKKRRKIVDSLNNLITKLESSPKPDEQTILEGKKCLVDVDLLLSSSDENKKILTLKEWFDKYEEEIEKRKSGKKNLFYNFIFDTLIPDGPRAGEIGIVVSTPGSGKSTCVLNVVSDLIDATVPNMYFSLEMSLVTTMDRLLAKRKGIPYSEIANPKEQNEYMAVIEAIQEERKKLENNKLFRFSEEANLSLPQLYQHIQKFQADIGQKYMVIIIDLLSMISDFCNGNMSMPQMIEIKMNELSALAKTLGVHIIGVLQYNRSAEAQAGQIRDKQDLLKLRPNRAQIKNSQAWLERARYVISTFREKPYAELYLPEEAEDMVDIMTATVLKYNNGIVGKSVDALFNAECFSVEPLLEEDEEI